MHKLDHWLEMVVPGAATLQNVFPGQIVEYNSMRAAAAAAAAAAIAGDDSGSAKKLASRDDARIVCFPLYPKPHQLDDECLLRLWEGREGERATARRRQRGPEELRRTALSLS